MRQELWLVGHCCYFEESKNDNSHDLLSSALLKLTWLSLRKYSLAVKFLKGKVYLFYNEKSVNIFFVCEVNGY